MKSPKRKVPENKLYYGDNLDVLRRYVKDELVDLVYLDPPFNSRQDYNVLFAEKDGHRHHCIRCEQSIMAVSGSLQTGHTLALSAFQIRVGWNSMSRSGSMVPSPIQ